MTPNDLFLAALQEINVTNAGDSTISPEDGLVCFTRFNIMLDAFKVDQLIIQCLARHVYDLDVGVADYTIGDGGDWDIARPNLIDYAGYVLTSTGAVMELEVDILTDKQWALTVLKGMSNSILDAIWYELAFPLGIVHTWPVQSVAGQIALYFRTALDTITLADVATEYVMPPGYQEMMVQNLAIRLARPFGREVTKDLRDAASLSMNRVKTQNFRPGLLRPQYPHKRQFNILTNGY